MKFYSFFVCVVVALGISANAENGRLTASPSEPRVQFVNFEGIPQALPERVKSVVKEKIGAIKQAKRESITGLSLFESTDNKYAIVDDYGNLLAYSNLSDEQAIGEIPPAMASLLNKYSKFTNALNAPRPVAYKQKLLQCPKFDQGRPFSKFMNEVVDVSDDYVIGCVGTAMATVMKYYNWPPHGRDEIDFSRDYGTWDNGVWQEITRHFYFDFENTYFDWDNILSDYNGNYTESQERAVGELSYAAAISVKTNFGYYSSAYAEDVPESLVKYFYYSPQTYCYYAVEMSSEEWEARLRAEIDAGRPVIYTGTRSEDAALYYDDFNGHAFVIDGYDESGLFHVNWGWGGRYDGYYALTSLQPYVEADYSYSSGAIFGIQPDRNMSDYPRVCIFLSSYHPQHIEGMISDHSTVKSNMLVRLANFCWKVNGEPFKKLETAVALCDASGNIRAISDNTKQLGEYDLPYQTGGFQGDEYFYSDINARNGDYLCMVYRGDDMQRWAVMDAIGPVDNYCSAYNYDVPYIPVTWKNIDDFTIRPEYPYESYEKDYVNNMVAGHYWTVVIESKKDFAHFHVLINGEINHENFYPTYNHSENRWTLRLMAYPETRKGENYEIECVTVSQLDVNPNLISVADVEPGTLKDRITEITKPLGVTKLKVQGCLTDEDFYFLRDNVYMLEELDIEEVTIKEHEYNPEDYLPYKCFENKYQLKKIFLPKGLQGFHNNSLSSTSIEKVFIPSSARVFGLNVFNSCTQLNEVTIAQNNPPAISWCVFSGSGRPYATLRVPKGTKEAYSQDPEWGQFGRIVEDENVVDGVSDIEVDEEFSDDNYVKEYFTIQGIRLSTPPTAPGLYIIRQGNKVRKEIIK